MPALVESRLNRHRAFDWNTGINVKYLRLLNDMEQKHLAEIADMDVSQLSRVESGQRSLKFKEGMAIAKALGVRPERLTRAIINNANSD